MNFKYLIAAFTALSLLFAGSAQAARQVVATFGSAGGDAGQLSAAVGGVAVNQTSGDVYVVDVQGAGVRVARFAADGTFEANVGSLGTGDGEFSAAAGPDAIAIDQSSGDFFVADTGNNRVQRFSAGGVHEAQFGEAGTGDGQFNAPSGVAVDPTSGDVLVADSGNNRVQRFSAGGAYLSQFGTVGAADGEFSAPTAVAVDSTGRTYVLDNGNARVQRFSAAGAFDSVFAASTLSLSPQFLDVDTITDHVFVQQYQPDFAGTQIVELDGAGALVETHGQLLPSTPGLALNHAAGRIYQLTPDGAVLILEEEQPATVAAPTTSALTATSVNVSTEIDLNGGLAASYRVETSTDDTTWTPQPSAGPISGNSSLPVSVTVTGLEPSMPYYARVVVTRPFHSDLVSDEISFTTAAAPPAASTRPPVVDGTTARLRATVDPQGLSTTYWFEYGPDTSYGTSVPVSRDADAGSGHDPLILTQYANGLPPGKLYHVRVVAQNAEGTTAGEDRVFETRAESSSAPSAPDACPNAAIRAAQGVTSLPDCRAYEQVSPVQKGGNSVGTFFPVRVVPNADAVSFWSTGAFPGSRSAPVMSTYVARRSADGWSTGALDPPQTNPGTPGPFMNAPMSALSRDMRRSLVWSRSALTAGAYAGGSNAYMQDNATGDLRLVLALDDGGALDTAYGSFSGGAGVAGATPDLSHVLFTSPAALVPGATEYNIYELDGDQVRLVSRAPDETPLGFQNVLPSATANPISADGRRIFWGHTRTQVYMREDGSHTVEISRPQRPGTDPDTEYFADFLYATPDGRNVFFQSATPLSADAEPAGPTTGSRLYRWRDGDLTELAVGAPAPGSPDARVLAATDDGDTVYYTNTVRVAGLNRARISVWRAGLGSHTIATLDQHPIRWDSGASSSVMSPDGKTFAFESLTELTGASHENDGCFVGDSSGNYYSGYCKQLYVYDLATDALACASCGRPGTPAVGFPGIGEMSSVFSSSGDALGGYIPSDLEQIYRPRAIADDGTVFFDSPAQLTGEDTDGKRDVYSYRSGQLRLLSPGTSSDAMFATVTPDGQSVVFATNDRLVGQDTDNNADVYVARVNGGLTGQLAAASKQSCEGDRCQGSPGKPPAPTDVSTDRPAGGDLPAPAVRARQLTKLSVTNPQTSRTTRIIVTIKAPAAGRVTVSGMGLRVGTRSVRAAQTVRLTVTLSASAVSRLKARGRLTVVARVGFAPDARGATQVRSVRLTFARKATRRVARNAHTARSTR